MRRMRVALRRCAAHLEKPQARARPQSGGTAQGARVVPYSCLDAAATDRTEDAQSYDQYGAPTALIMADRATRKIATGRPSGAAGPRWQTLPRRWRGALPWCIGST